jgi:prevent-host-death family protein
MYCSPLDRCYLLPIELVQVMRTIHLRFGSPPNGQCAALHWAADYELSGAVAQLGERRAGSAKAGGSSPPSSTHNGEAPTVVGAHELRNRFGWSLERAAAGEDIRVTRRGRPWVRLTAQEADAPRPP